jgi:hypothetical protein
MTLHFVKLPNSNNVVFYVPLRFQKSKGTESSYKKLMLIFLNVFNSSNGIIAFLNKFQIPTESEISLKLKVLEFKDLVIDCRRKYVVESWRPEDSERLHNEMTVDVSNLLKKHSEIGKLLRQVKNFRK